jgi:hypothetical protein
LKRCENAPLIAQILTIALLIGSLPVAASPVITPYEAAPAFMLNVCHPLPSFTIGAVSCSLPMLTKCSFERHAIGGDGVMPDFVPATSGRSIGAPDPPPPKSLI